MADPTPLNVTMLNELNALVDTKINPALAASIPASIALNEHESVRTIRV
jgi:hypothetical protein